MTIPDSALALTPDCLPVVMPLIVPASYGRFDFPAPLEALAHPGLALTWVALSTPTSMTYVMPRIVDVWTEQGLPWKEEAMANMRRFDRGRTWTHERRNEAGDLVWCAMIHEDGLGSSRLLCCDELAAQFPWGYSVALPDRSCGLVLSATASAAETADFADMVSTCHRDATIPMVGTVLDPSTLRPRDP